MSMPSLSAAAFRASVRDRLKTEAKKSGRPVKELQREFVLQRFLSRVFAAADSPWVLKGGAGLLIRLPGARYSQDLDLLHPSENLETAIEELKELSRGPGGDPFSFVVRDPVKMSGGVTAVKVNVPGGNSLLPIPNRLVDRAAFRGPSGAPAATPRAGNPWRRPAA
jgi:Nucleotidyl transferase AbiEii toxin, Type IV TA system